MNDPIKFKPKGDYSDHVFAKDVGGEKVQVVDIDSMTEEQWQKYCRDSGIEPFQRLTYTINRT